MKIIMNTLLIYLKNKLRYWYCKKLSIFLIFLIFSASGLEAKIKPKTKIEKFFIEHVLSQIEATYEKENAQEFSQILDNDFENRLTFISNLDNYFLSVKFLNLYLILDTYLIDKDKVLVKLHWFKKEINNSGVFKKLKGSSEFCFKDTPEGLKLLYIRKDNPFF